MATLTQPPVLYYICSKRCGEIRMTPNYQRFQLMCDFCTRVFEDFLEFQLHMRKKHCAYDDTTINSNSNNNGKQSNMNISELAQRVDLGTSLTVRDLFTETYQEQRTQKKTLNHQQDEVVTETLEHKVIITEANNDVDGAQSLENTVMDPLAIAAPTLIKAEPISDDDESNNIACDITEKETSKPKQTENFGRKIRSLFIGNKKKLYTFIEIIKRKPVLWTTEYAYDERVKALLRVAILMNSKFKCMEFSEKSVLRHIRHLYAIWTKMKEGKMQKAWFYQYLNFFHARNLKNPETNLRLNIHYNYLIDEYKMHEVLWNYKHPQYINKYEEDIAYNEITKKMCQKFPQHSYNKKNIIHKINHLKCAYTKMCAGKIPKIWYFEKLKFLNIATKEELAIVENINWQEKKKHVFTAMDELLKKAPDTVYEKVNSLLDNFADNDSMSDYSDFEGFSEDVEQVSVNVSKQITGIPNEMLQKEGENVLDLEQNDSGEVVDNRDQHQNDQVEEGINNDGVSLTLINLYKKHKNLWNNTDNHPDHLLYFKNFAKILNARYNFRTKLNFVDVRDRIRQLTHDYRTNSSASIYSKFLTFLPKPEKNQHKCSTCHLTFDRSKALLLHEYRMHNKHRHFKCNQCGKGFRTKFHLECHSLVHMKRDELPYLCELCGEHFRCKARYRTHKSKEHNAPWDYECDICQAGFGTRTQMLTHQRIHTGERPYLCQECGKSYRLLGGFIQHRDRHANNPRFKCTMCDKRYYTGTKLKNHMRTKHSVAREFVCDICGKDFARKKNLYTHKQIHAKDKKYKCRFCSQSFKQQSGCYNHMRQQHKDAE